MASTQQRLHSIHFGLLKNLKNLELDLEPCNVTGIFGVNGSGKSTIIHALLCIFKPKSNDSNKMDYRFNQFFIPTTHSRYNGSNFSVTHSFREASKEFNKIQRQYSKDNRWKPRYDDRPDRDVYFLGISTCVPEVETLNTASIIKFQTTIKSDPVSNLIRQKAGYILNRDYSEYSSHSYKERNRNFIGVTNDQINYSSLNMGAGEQRTFKILEVVFQAEKNSLIIIDEIDLTLHTNALKKLILTLIERAKEKELQIIFTSHREEITKIPDINIRHIYQSFNKTFCFNKTTPDCIERLNGERISTLEVFVEDNLAQTIVYKVIEELNIRRHCTVRIFGAIGNCFSLATSFVLREDDTENILILLDGDKYTNDEERLTQIKKHFSGTERVIEEKRNIALKCIKQFILKPDLNPEQYISKSINELNDNSEIVKFSNEIKAVNDKHEYINNILEKLGYSDRSQGLNKIVDKFCLTNGWMNYTSEIRRWLEDRISQLNLLA